MEKIAGSEATTKQNTKRGQPWTTPRPDLEEGRGRAASHGKAPVQNAFNDVHEARSDNIIMQHHEEPGLQVVREGSAKVAEEHQRHARLTRDRVGSGLGIQNHDVVEEASAVHGAALSL